MSSTTYPQAAHRPDGAADRELKARLRSLWGLGDYPAVAREVIPELGRVVVDAAGVRPGDRVLDVAAGSGNAALPAARAGGDVVASDLAPELFPPGRAAAEAEGLRVRWDEGDAEALPYPDASFDVVVSCVGVMFAPHHQEAAAELLRVTRRGGRIALVTWTSEGFVGQLLATLKPYAAPPPAGSQPPALWGTPAHVEELLGSGVEDLVTERRTLVVDRFADGAAFRDFFRRTYGPIVATYARAQDDPEAVAALDDAIAALGDRALDGGRTMGWEYLLVTATRR